MKTLFPFGLPKNCVFHEMYKEEMGIEKSMKNYEKILPKKIDLLLLSVGLDGHIASIFPRSKILNSNHLVDVVYGGNPLVERISLTPSAIKRAKKTCVFALGLEKSQLYRNALIDSKNFEEMPARLVLNAEWLNSDDINGIAKRISNLICAL
jgi:6-phosphogluconolactonase